MERSQRASRLLYAPSALCAKLLLALSWLPLGMAQAYLGIIWTRLLRATLSPLETMASAQTVPAELLQDMHLAPNLASGVSKALREKQGRLWQPEVSGSIFSSIVEENRRGGLPGPWAQPRGLHGRTDARSGTSQSALFGLAPVPCTGGPRPWPCPEQMDLTQAARDSRL